MKNQNGGAGMPFAYIQLEIEDCTQYDFWHFGLKPAYTLIFCLWKGLSCYLCKKHLPSTVHDKAIIRISMRLLTTKGNLMKYHCKPF